MDHFDCAFIITISVNMCLDSTTPNSTDNCYNSRNFYRRVCIHSRLAEVTFSGSLLVVDVVDSPLMSNTVLFYSTSRI